MKVKKKKRMMQRPNPNLPSELLEQIWLILQLREQERERDPDLFYLDDPPLSDIWRDAIVIR